MTRFLEFTKERSTSGFGCSILLTQVAASKKSPPPGKMVGIPALKRCCDVARENNVRGIGRNAKNDQALRERRKNEGHGERIKSPGGQACQHLQRQHGPKIS